MNKSILIVDDDQDFSQLLRGVVQQADYTVHTAFSADQGFEMLERGSIELIVTDHRLPGGITGTEFLTKLRDKGIDLPVIVVSGFLNDEAIRELIRDGVSGIFIKPLNIFSLLKKSSEILEERAKALVAAGAVDGDGEPLRLNTIGHIEGASTEGKAFLQKARKAANFQRNLLLIGPPGTPFEDISRDLVALAETPRRSAIIAPGGATDERLKALLEGENADKPVTLILMSAEKFSQEEVDRLIELGDEKGGANGSVRMVFCLGKSVEDLYDNELIDEEFYLFLGTNELKVPPLRKMPEDLIAMARKEIQQHLEEEANLETKLRLLLLAHDWPENFVELRSVVLRAVTLAQPMMPEARHFESALHAKEGDAELDAATSTFERFLLQEKRAYEAARKILLAN